MKLTERVKMVKAMEFIARQVNDENVFMSWLSVGVADGDIDYGDMNPVDEDVEWYAEEDERFADLMDVFLRIMSRAYKSGGLYCDDVVSKKEE